MNRSTFHFSQVNIFDMFSNRFSDAGIPNSRNQDFKFVLTFTFFFYFQLEPTVNVKNVSSQFCSHTEELIDEYASMLNGSRSRTMLFSSPQYTTFISDARAIAEKTRSCVYSGLLDKTKSLYPWRLRTVSMVVSPVVQDGRNWNSRTIPKF